MSFMTRRRKNEATANVLHSGFVACFCVLIVGVSAGRQMVTDTSVCDLQSRPEHYAGRMVRFPGTWTRGPRQIAIDDLDGRCGPILVELPNDPELRPRARFTLVEDADLTKFLESRYVLIPNAKTHTRGRINATLQGRFDVAAPGQGFGHGGLFHLRLVLQKITNVSVSQGAGD
jgi:hypothetical protein